MTNEGMTSDELIISPEISTIIPVLNDAVALRECLSALGQCANAHINEIIVADGGASAEIAGIAQDFHAAYVSCARGRAVQMNRAAQQARGAWLWFLHADCLPDAQSLCAILELRAQDAWGCFKHRIESERRAFRVIETMDNVRAGLGCPYGDQGIFVRAEIFRGLKGYPEVPLLEDVLLGKNLRELSAPRVLKPVLRANARRWERRGISSTMLRNWRIMFEFLSGRKTPHELAAFYE